MDLGRLLFHLLRLYVWGLVFLGVGTVAWTVFPRHPANEELAGIWFAIGGFGLLVLAIAVLIWHFE